MSVHKFLFSACQSWCDHHVSALGENSVSDKSPRKPSTPRPFTSSNSTPCLPSPIGRYIPPKNICESINGSSGLLLVLEAPNPTFLLRSGLGQLEVQGEGHYDRNRALYLRYCSHHWCC
ncbi:hypothetical protein BDV38DRAFT_260368 [Aspergillus pseudotamarii]|uniref:Uncharacterized protein n=1 Tax=Aspergillus pseudotamarii TaxID=132259 RepID=A0A5N6SFM5_ASPPS|nr:uncharacterized protein BDV38DRAFT_260368 [Aspergillus pseudotamarii]KAE8132737.1 hypothetical protein BDV38DRAFT_260368 [Aspergillus pseudotamarii]